MKKSIKLTAALCAVVLISCCSIGIACSAEPVVTDGTSFYNLGDANTDKNVDVRDLVRVKKVLAEQEGVTMLEAAADIDTDGTVTAADMTLLKKHLISVEGAFDAADGNWSSEIR